MPRANPRATKALDLDGVDRFTLPVRDLARAELFYTHVLGGDVVARGITEMSQVDHPAVRVRICEGVDVVLVRQYYGWNPVDSTNPHWGFAIPGAEVDAWVEHLKEWEVPHALLFSEADQEAMGVPTRVELHFLDPDGNQLELVAWDYPMNDRAWMGQYDPWTLVYSPRTWPPASASHLLESQRARARD